MSDKEIHEQQLWMDHCGGSLAGYIKQYGSMHSPDHHGDGGEMIWAADMAELIRLYAQMQGHMITAEEAMKEVMKQVINEGKAFNLETQ